MRNLMCLMLVLSGLALGCGSDGDKKETDEDKDPAGAGDGDGDNAGDGDGDGDGDDPVVGGDAGMGGDGDIVIDPPSEGGNKYPMCPRADIPNPTGYEGTKPFSLEEAQACQEKCKMDNECFFACPGAEAWAICIQNEAVECTSQPGGICRPAHDDLICCQNQPAVLSECQALVGDEAQGECFYMKCEADFTALFTNCVLDQTKPAAAECVNKARTDCFGNDPDEPAVPPAKGTNLSVMKASQQLLLMQPDLLKTPF